MKTPILYALRCCALLSFLFSFCLYGQNSKTSSSSQTDVYIVGRWDDRSTGQSFAAYFKNGKPVVLKDGLGPTRFSIASSARAIAVNDGDVHVVGSARDANDNEIATYWKNEKFVPLPIKRDNSGNTQTASAHGIGVSNGNVYILPYHPGHQVEYYYLKNGVETNFPQKVYRPQVFDLINFVSGSDIYIAMEGHDAGYWKNGEKVILDNTMKGHDRVQVSSIFVSGNDVYVSGFKSYPSKNADNTNKSMALYWKNGQEVILSTGTGRFGSRSTKSIYVSGNDVYVAGMTQDENTGASRAVYWKNGQEVVLAEGPTFTQAVAIAVSGNDVYVAGQNSNRYVYWKNGKEINLPDCSDIRAIALSSGNSTSSQSPKNNTGATNTTSVDQAVDLIKAKESADLYLAQMRKIPGIIETQSGLLYQVLKEGAGPRVTFDQFIAADYRISFHDGIERPGYTGGVGGTMSASSFLIKGMQEAVQLMQAGGIYRFIVPYDLAYGKTGKKTIPPYSVFIYDVKALQIK